MVVLESNIQSAVHATSSDAALMAAVGTDLSRYQWVYDRPIYEPLAVKRRRNIVEPLAKAYLANTLGWVPNPVMMTHIVTTRCNYSCHFCSFADTLNAKSNELSLEEIEKTYQTLGQDMNTVVYSGGETTLHKNLPEIIEAAYRYTPVQSVYIISNAWKPDRLFEITHQVMQRCPDLHLTWSLSIEGPKSVNNAVRHTQKDDWDAWQNTVDTMWGLKEMRRHFGYRQLDVQLCTVCGPNNEGIMSDWYTMVRDVLQPDKWNLNLLRKSVQMSDHELGDWSDRRQTGQKEPFEQTYERITQQVRSDVLSGKLKFLYHTQSVGDGAMKSAIDLMSQAENRGVLDGQPASVCCKAGRQGAYIGSDGEISGCEEFANNPKDKKSYGNLRDVNYDFQALWRGEKAKAFRELSGQSAECYGCTLESQKNYPSMLVSLRHLWEAKTLAQKIQ